MPKYRVHIYALVRVPVDLEAPTPIEAARKAENETDLYSAVKRQHIEYAEDVESYLVDELNDDGEWNGKQGVTFYPDKCRLLRRTV